MIEIEAEIVRARVRTDEHGAIPAQHSEPESIMKSLALGILGAAALATTVLLVHREMAPSSFRLDRIRELGL
jgi:hypothetical protein